MDSLSSSELDSPSKTPLFIAIAAILLGIAGLWLAWTSFSRISELEKKLAEVESAAQGASEMQDAIDASSARVEQVVANMNTLSQNVSDALNEVGSDITKVRSDVRKVAIEAGTAKKMVEELEKSGVRVASAPAPSRASSSSSEPAQTSKSPDASPGKSGVYTIKSGDTLGKIAAAYKITLTQLQSANPGVDPRRLRIGQQIVIPAAQ
ncbi:LysM domain-containing protein [Pelagicoccus sp. SDUM812003]|uniref:LysM peptidoglycan-binding domain-containing protein n=1 Tax=Pelagicoccus sp. SDUM812003 TaxID=3041267 RepID=UPI00280FE829|nr:LysM domain-containing protein [Pelagicoccus sp. SDUM812003]MDQ8205300.1 LysM domain-containing protein [Pelagicoccus sp. SDUM812003]